MRGNWTILAVMLLLAGCATRQSPTESGAPSGMAKSQARTAAAAPAPGWTNRLVITWTPHTDYDYRFAEIGSNGVVRILTNYTVIEGRTTDQTNWVRIASAARPPILYSTTNRGMIFRAKGEWQ